MIAIESEAVVVSDLAVIAAVHHEVQVAREIPNVLVDLRRIEA
jgi:hypothetical protein